MLERYPLTRLPFDLLGDAVNVVGDHPMHVGGVCLPVAETATGHEVDYEPEAIACGGLEGVDLVQGWDSDLPGDVLGRDDSLKGVLGDAAAASRVEKDLLQGVEGVLLCCQPDGTFLHRHDEVVDHRRRERVDPPGLEHGQDLSVEYLLDRAYAAGRVMTLPRQPSGSVVPETLLADLTLEVGLGARSGPFLFVDLGQSVERRLLCRVPGLLALASGGIAVANDVWVGATVLAGAGATLEEAAHSADELGRQVHVS